MWTAENAEEVDDNAESTLNNQFAAKGHASIAGPSQTVNG